MVEVSWLTADVKANGKLNGYALPPTERGTPSITTCSVSEYLRGSVATSAIVNFAYGAGVSSHVTAPVRTTVTKRERPNSLISSDTSDSEDAAFTRSLASRSFSLSGATTAPVMVSSRGVKKPAVA